MRLFPKSSFELTEAEKTSFKNIIHQLSSITALAHPQSATIDYQLVNESNQYAVDAALHQLIDKKLVPIYRFLIKEDYPKPKLNIPHSTGNF